MRKKTMFENTAPILMAVMICMIGFAVSVETYRALHSKEKELPEKQEEILHVWKISKSRNYLHVGGVVRLIQSGPELFIRFRFHEGTIQETKVRKRVRPDSVGIEYQSTDDRRSDDSYYQASDGSLSLVSKDILDGKYKIVWMADPMNN